ncbi:sigma-70 family RNA polymerase sigma factor [Kitasatospora sp. NPDC051914]|uniref:RNA polymerase sigma factor n=1 Tax=Kitasatospora sp. NPDC051914 TaxID=3154945 RepID=UPI00341552A9
MTSLLESPVAAGSPVLHAYGRHVDGLFTYCLSVLCEHDAAVAAVGEVRDLALRHGDRLADPALRRAWLYALARHCCLRRLEHGADAASDPSDTAAPSPARETGGARHGRDAAGPARAVDTVRRSASAAARRAGGRGSTARGGRSRPGGSGPADGGAAGAGPIGTGGAPGAAVVAQRRTELAKLAWPEAAGTGPEQREALELAVRHGLAAVEVAAVLGLPAPAAEELLESAGAEVARTRAALLVLGANTCPELAQLGGAGAGGRSGWVLGPALRRELVQHVVDCPTCRGTAGRVAGELEPGPTGLEGLPLLTAPVTVRVGTTAAQVPGGAAGAAFLAGAAAGRRLVSPEQGAAAIRFDQRGFPRHRAPSAGLAMVRQRVVTTGVLAAVLTAPVAALWAAYRGGESVGAATPVSSVRVDSPTGAPDASGAERPDGSGLAGAGGRDAAPDGLQLAGSAGAETLLPAVEGAVVPVPSHGSQALAAADLAPVPPAPPAKPGLLTVEASEWGSRTVITLTNSGGTTIHWHAEVGVDWLRLSRDEGTLEPGRRITVTVTVDEERVPAGHWTARIALPPSEAVVTLEGGPTQRGGQSGDPAGGSSAPTEPSDGGAGGTGGSRSPEPPSGGGTPSDGSTPGGGQSSGDRAPGGSPSDGSPSNPAPGGDPAPAQGSASPPPADGDGGGPSQGTGRRGADGGPGGGTSTGSGTKP